MACARRMEISSRELREGATKKGRQQKHYAVELLLALSRYSSHFRQRTLLGVRYKRTSTVWNVENPPKLLIVLWTVTLQPCEKARP